ncbi:MAG: hypothetical protein FD167_5328, partial [bacterium]
SNVSESEGLSHDSLEQKYQQKEV